VIFSLLAVAPGGPPKVTRKTKRKPPGTLGGTASAGNAINSVGGVTGFSTEASGVQLATLWANGQQIPLGTLGGAKQ
jgi:probable HAF family extracellular repeat protein